MISSSHKESALYCQTLIASNISIVNRLPIDSSFNRFYYISVK